VSVSETRRQNMSAIDFDFRDLIEKRYLNILEFV
jgi:hypothetical protein